MPFSYQANCRQKNITFKRTLRTSSEAGYIMSGEINKNIESNEGALETRLSVKAFKVNLTS